MKKPLYNIFIFIFHIITIVLLVALCLHSGIIRFSFVNVSKDTIFSFFSNDYVINISCTIITAVTLYIIQIQYSKHKLKNDFRCNEIIHDLYHGIDKTMKLVKASKEVLGELDELKKEEDTEFDGGRKVEAERFFPFTKNTKWNLNYVTGS